jgi:hypothetical protein
MSSALRKKLQAKIPEHRREFEKWLSSSGPGDGPIEHWPIVSGLLHWVLFAAEEYGEAAELSRWQAENLDQYLKVKPEAKTDVEAHMNAEAYMLVRRAPEASYWYRRTLQMTKNTQPEIYVNSLCAYGFAMIEYEDDALACIDTAIDGWTFRAKGTKGAALARDFEQIRRAEVLFLLRDLDECRNALQSGISALKRARDENISYFRDQVGWYEDLANGMTSSLQGAADAEDASASLEGVRCFEHAIPGWVRYGSWHREIYSLRMDSLVARGVGPPAAKDDAYRAYVESFGEELTAT